MKKTISGAVAVVLGISDIELEHTSSDNFGDYTTNIAMIQAKDKKVNPKDLAQLYKNQIEESGKLAKYVEKIEIAGPGFINFYLKKEVFTAELAAIASKKDEYGKSEVQAGRKIMFEYAHPNTHKAFHIGHLRNITTGETLARLTEATGAKVIRANYQGDVGLHIAKALWGINSLGFTDPEDVQERAKFLGKAYAAGSTAYEDDESAKEEIHSLNAKVYDKSDKDVNKLYEETRKWSLDYFETIYKRVYTVFDRLYFESECAESGKELAQKALEEGILKESEGAVIFPGSDPKYGLHDRVFITGKGVPTYEGKDLGLARLQFKEYDPDKLIHIVGPEQKEYFRVIFKALEYIIPETKGREIHIPYGWVRLKEGKMSSRTGNVILGEWLLDEAKSSIKKSFDTEDEIAEKIAVGAVKYSFLKNGLGQDIAFDLKESISLEGNSGPYLMYTYARCMSLISKAKVESGSIQMPKEMNPEEESVVKALYRYSEVVEASALSYAPNLLCNNLFDVASRFNAFYNKHKIIGEDNETFRVGLSSAVSQVLKNGLSLLGITVAERM